MKTQGRQRLLQGYPSSWAVGDGSSAQDASRPNGITIQDFQFFDPTLAHLQERDLAVHKRLNGIAAPRLLSSLNHIILACTLLKSLGLGQFLLCILIPFPRLHQLFCCWTASAPSREKKSH